MLTITTGSDKVLEKQQVALREIRELATARFSYNIQMARFFKNASTEEIKNFSLKELKIFTEEKAKIIQNYPEGHPFLVEVKGGFLASAQGDAKFYLQVQKAIDEDKSASDRIDLLHYLFSQRYSVESNKIQDFHAHQFSHAKDKKSSRQELKLSSQSRNSFLENIFFRDCLNTLEPLVSDVERKFVEEFEFKFEGDIREGVFLAKIKPNSILERCRDFRDELLTIAQKGTEIFGEAWNIKGLLDDATVQNMSYFHWAEEYLGTREGQQDAWRAYRTLHNAYLAMREAKKIFSDYIELLKAEKDQVTIGPKPLPVLEIVTPVVPPEPELEHEPGPKLEASSVPELEPQALLLEDAPEPVDYFQQKTIEYKAQVQMAREEKERLKRKELLEAKRLVEQQKNAEAVLLAKKEECNRRNAFNLLFGLNSGNLQLIQLIFKKPTPHQEIRYSEIEGLFGTGMDGKLPGAISSVSGSHRKISIDQVIGFFDEPQFSTQVLGNPSSSQIVGGTFEAHKKGNKTKLPSIAIELIREPLERSGITEKNLALFIEAKEAVESLKENSYDASLLLAKAIEIEAEKAVLIVALGDGLRKK